MMHATLIHNALLVDASEAQPRPGSLLIDQGRIAAINPSEPPPTAARVDAQGQWLAPGIIDIGVFATDKPAFHFGGKPDLWVHPLAAATKGLAGADLAEMALMQRAGARAVATGRSRIADARVMARVLGYAAALGLTVITHAEDEGLVAGAVATEGEVATRLGLPAAPAIAEALAVYRDLTLAEWEGAALHFRQLTTAESFDLLRAAKARGVRVTAAITPAHLFLSDIATADFRTFARLSPPLRGEHDRLAALDAVADGTIDILCSGHDPRGPEDKRLPFAEAQPGMAGAESLLALGLGLVRDGRITPGRLFAMLAANPAKLLGVNAGVLAVGAEADLILVDEGRPWQIDAKKMAASAGNTPFDGLPVQGRVMALWKGGIRLR
jgi:dihydroorotase